MTTSASDFFERQEAARRATRRLVLWFSLGVAGTALAIYFVLCLLLGEAGGGNLTEAWFPGTPHSQRRHAAEHPAHRLDFRAGRHFRPGADPLSLRRDSAAFAFPMRQSTGVRFAKSASPLADAFFTR